MKRNCIILLGCLIMASCTINKYYIVNDNAVSKVSNLEEMTSQFNEKPTKAAKTIEYDEALPVVPKLSVIKDASEYDKEDKYTFPIFGNETAVAPPTTQGPKIAIWCTKEATVVANLYQLSWDLHYFQKTPDSYIEDMRTGKRYYIKGSYDGTPMGISYNIKGVSGEWICLFELYPPLPKKCTTINIIDGQVNDVVKNGPGWSGPSHLRGVPVSWLQDNQCMVKFQKTKIIE